jgi:putative ABC transport system substrate-binding protein
MYVLPRFSHKTTTAEGEGCEGEMNKRKLGSFALCALLPALCASAEAQQPKKIPRIAYLTAAPLPALTNRLDAFRQGLRELGYVEGKDILIEWRSADGKVDNLPPLAAELVQLKVDIIITGGGAVTRPVKEATSTIPIVMAQDTDPVGNGFVASLARPGGNITGLSTFAPELSAKRLELIKEIIPKISHVAVFQTPTDPGNTQAREEMELAAGALVVKLQYLDVHATKDFEPTFRAAINARANAGLMNVSGPISLSNRNGIEQLATKYRLPMIYTLRDFVEVGGLVSYGVVSPACTTAPLRVSTRF